MAYWFADSFDLYTLNSDTVPSAITTGWWDGPAASNAVTLVAGGRFATVVGGASAGQAYYVQSNGGLFKNSGANDAVHHVCISVMQSSVISGASIWNGFQLCDGATPQVGVFFCQDGRILITSGLSGGTILATYPAAVNAQNTWYGFEIEVVIHNTAGSVAIRKNGNPVNDFLATGLNTRNGTANAYANRLNLAMGGSSLNQQTCDDLLWRSDASSLAWVGDIRSYVRHPVTDQSIQWTPSGPAAPVTPYPLSITSNISVNYAYYTPFTTTCAGTVGSVAIRFNVANTGNVKCAMFGNAAGQPGALLATATTVSNNPGGLVTFTFPSPPAVANATQYWIGFSSDTSVTQGATLANATPSVLWSTGTYAGFPAANPPVNIFNNNAHVITVNITPTAPNSAMTAEWQQDSGASYVASSTIGQTDLYGIASIPATPVTVYGVATRAFVSKTDGGPRSIAVQLKSGATTVAATTLALNTIWGWNGRIDLVDPATGAAWTATAVNNAQIGVTVIA